MDGSAEDYTNCSDDAVRDGKNECGVVSLDRASIGKWLDDSCVRKALVVCQKRQVITFHVLKTAVDNITDTIQAQNGQIAAQAKEMQILKGKTTYLTDQMARQYQLLVEQNDLVNGLKMKVEGGVGGVGKLILPEPIFGQNNSTISATISALDRMVVSQTNEILSLKKSLMESSRDNSQLRSELIPVGFIYTQLPDQAPPSLIWPRFFWTDITFDYAGLFFGTEGGNSSSFGTLQGEQSPRLLKVHKHPGEADLWGDVVVDLVPGEKTKKLYTGGNSGNDVSLSFLLSKGEVKPVKKAILIWKRTG